MIIYPGDILAIPKIEDFPIDKLAKRFAQAIRYKLYIPNIRIENGILKIDNMMTTLPVSIHSTKVVRETLETLGYTVVRGHTMENVECDYRMCGGTKLFTIEKKE